MVARTLAHYRVLEKIGEGGMGELDDSVAEPPPTHLVLVQNFDEELKRLVLIEL